MTDWHDLTQRAALASHRLVGWIYWDPPAIERFAALGAPPFAYYITSRGAPLLAAGHQVLTSVYYSISAAAVQVCVDAALAHTTADAIFEARNAAVGEGLRTHVPELCDPLGELAAPAWATVDQLDSSGRPFFAAHRQMPRPDDLTTSAWLAFNAIREWRGDTHFAILTAEGISGVQAGLLHDAHLDYGDWIAQSRGADEQAIADAFADLERRGLADGGAVNAAGLALRQRIEERTDELCAPCWVSLGEDVTTRFLDLIEPSAGAVLLARIDETAGPKWMPAARVRSAG